MDSIRERNDQINIKNTCSQNFSEFSIYCGVCLLRKKWLSRCTSSYTIRYKKKLYLFCSESCKKIFQTDYWLFTHLSKQEVITHIRKCNRIFINVGFGSECLEKVIEISKKPVSYTHLTLPTILRV